MKMTEIIGFSLGAVAGYALTSMCGSDLKKKTKKMKNKIIEMME